MRNLKKNQRVLYYAPYLGTRPIVDEYGNDTLEVEKIYGEPQKLNINYSTNTGQEVTSVFGSLTNYSRTICFTGESCPLKEKDILWIRKDITEKANYEVLKVADSLNSWLLAIGEIV